MASRDNEHESSRPEVSRPVERTESNAPSAPDFKADKLLSESKSVLGTDKKEQQNPIKDGQLSFTNIYDETKSNDTRLKTTFPAEKKGLGSLADAPGKDSAVKSPEFAVKGDLSKIDPKKPTVAFLDDASDHGLRLDGQDFNHANVSAMAAQKGGYNAIVLDIGQSAPNKALDAMSKAYQTGQKGKVIDSGIAELDKAGADRMGLDKLSKTDYEKAGQKMLDARDDFSRPLNEIANKVRSGELPLGKGDVVNVSLGNNASGDNTGDPTFAELSKKVGFEVNSSNLEENKQRVLDKLGDIAKDPSDPAWQKRAQDALKTNQAIDNVQSLGIEVVHSASNDGNNRVDINFLKAQHELQSADPSTGKQDKFSGYGNRTTDGVVPIYRSQENPQDVTYKMGGIDFNHSELRQLNGQFGATPMGGDKLQNDVSTMGSKFPADQAKLNNLFNEKVGRPAPGTQSKDGDLAAIAVGNSFDNIEFLQGQYNRLRSKKQDAANIRF